jgi:hypothetical protein
VSVADLRDRILERDARGYLVLEAISATDRKSLNTASRPCALVAIDGKTYWVKASVQQGLVAELIAGRLAEKLHCGPPVRILRVTPGALASEPDCAHLEGVVFGSREVLGTENARDLAPLLAAGRFDPSKVDAAARARVAAFQTWVGASDAQVLINFREGAVLSIDHGDVFGDVSDVADPVPQMTSVPGLDDSVGRRMGDLMAGVLEIEAITEAELVDAVTGVPHGDPWKSPVERRAEIIEYLVRRQTRLRDVLTGWASK